MRDIVKIGYFEPKQLYILGLSRESISSVNLFLDFHGNDQYR